MTTTTDTLTDLHRAILIDPADDTARLVYADCLQEHGEEARAEFIRVGVELAKVDMTVWQDTSPESDMCWSCWIKVTGKEKGYQEGISKFGCQCSGRVIALRARERKLKKELVIPLWDGERPGEAAGIGAVHSRGFVSTITLPAAAFTEAVARTVFSAHPVTRVVLSDKRPNRDRGMGDGPNVSLITWDWCDGVDATFGVTGALMSILRERNPAWFHRSLYLECPSEPLAQLALSDSYVCWGRRLVGLPDLPLPTELEAAR